ncbi:transglycosylase domain-containing protein [Streptomyces griseofuscus]|uniref:transglycosylase domain-containing protein n=1 Tax=Streptomyces griseofuscus TaxID=146922 RepID=UPI003699CE26
MSEKPRGPAGKTGRSESEPPSPADADVARCALRDPGERRGRRRLVDYPRAGRSGPRRWLPSWKQVSAAFLLLCGALAGLLAYVYATTVIPSANPSTQAQSNTYYWSDGSVMTTQGATDRQNVGLDQVPESVRWDFLAAENATFYTDPGVDTNGMLRAVYLMVTGGDVQSGSTITQQFVKNTFLSQDQSIGRKLKEIMISLKIDDKMSKQQILQGYLNSSYYGRSAYGIEAAARAYYDEHASQLTVSQGAFIAATVNEPSLLTHADTDPRAEARAKARWRYVLDRMTAIHKLTKAQEQRYLVAGFPMPVPYKPSAGMSGQTGYLMDTAQKYVEAHSSLTEQQLGRGGYQIHTTFDKKKVNALEASVAAMRRKHLDPDHHSADKDVEIGAASVDPATGALLALYGGAGWDKGHWTDNADTAGVPAGSAFEPISLAAGLDHHAVLPPGLQPNGTPGKWSYSTLRSAMEQSSDQTWIQLGEDVGYDGVRKEALRAGLLPESLRRDTPGFYAGASTPSPIRMADAYATFGDRGVQHEPYSVTRVVADGRRLPGFGKPKATTAMPASTADTVTDFLQGAVYGRAAARGHARVPTLDRPIAGKAGTTDNHEAAWFIGYTPQLVTAVSMFKEDAKSGVLRSLRGVGDSSHASDADLPTAVWSAYMTAALRGLPVRLFTPGPMGLAAGGSDDAPTADSTAVQSPPPTAPDSSRSGIGSCHGHSVPCPGPDPTGTVADTGGPAQDGPLDTTGGATSPGPTTSPSALGRR